MTRTVGYHCYGIVYHQHYHVIRRSEMAWSLRRDVTFGWRVVVIGIADTVYYHV